MFSSESEHKKITGDTVNINIHSPGIDSDCEDCNLQISRDVNLATGSSDLSAEDIIDTGHASLTVIRVFSDVSVAFLCIAICYYHQRNSYYENQEFSKL